MVTAPCDITEEQEKDFRKIAVKLAELVKLKGIMDVEVIDDHGEFKVLEIDARIPSQTPTVVYHTTGVNLVEELAELFCRGRVSEKKLGKKKYCSYEHLMIKDGSVTEHGEHIMSQGGPLTLRKNFFGADEVISDFIREGLPWRGTFINWADTKEELAEKRENMKLSLLGL
jgi:pyrrolysine biosynthesis protein PylC